MSSNAAPPVQERVNFFERLTAANAAVAASSQPKYPASSGAVDADTAKKREEPSAAPAAAAAAAVSHDSMPSDNPRITLMRRLGKLSDSEKPSASASSATAPVSLLNFRSARKSHHSESTVASRSSPAAKGSGDNSLKPAAGKKSESAARFSSAAAAGGGDQKAPSPAASSTSESPVAGAKQRQPMSRARHQPRRLVTQEDGDGGGQRSEEDSVPREIPAWAHPGFKSGGSAQSRGPPSSSGADQPQPQSFGLFVEKCNDQDRDNDDHSDPCPADALWDMVLRSTVFKDNEIKMRRQIALWECCERKLKSGSWIEPPPFATSTSF